MLLYREISRQIWNSYFLKLDWYENMPDRWEYFDEVSNSLFQNTVLKQVFEGRKITATASNYYEAIRVKPSLGPLGYPAMWARPGGPLYEWKKIQLRTETNDFRFMAFFDWTTERSMDCQFARGKLIASEEYPELVDNDFILELWGISFQTAE